MSIESEIESAVKKAISNLTIEAELDCDNDIEITVYFEGEEVCRTCVEVSQIYLTKEP